MVNDYWALSKVRGERSHVVLNTYEAMPGPFTMQPDMQFPASEIVKAVKVALGGREPMRVDATQLATALLGDAIATNLFMLGYAWQQGLVPLSREAILRAIELNGAAVSMNTQAFQWGRLAAINLSAVIDAAGIDHHAVPGERVPDPFDDSLLSGSLAERIARRVAMLTDYQNAAYAERYRALVERVRSKETQIASGSTALTEAVARYAYKLMAYKDEYEVARLYTSGHFLKQIEAQFEGDYRLHVNLAPPLLAKRDDDGHLTKSEYGPWMLKAFGLIKHLRFLRGTAFDPFGRSEERRTERALIEEYVQTIEQLLPDLNPERIDLATQIAAVPEHIRGYGHVKEAHLAKAKAEREALLAQWQDKRLG